MSHELVLIFLDPDTPERKIEDAVDKLMEPHSDVRDPNNPDAKCDGWIIGGRFDKMIFGVQPEYGLSPEEFQKRYGMRFEHVKVISNVRPVSEMPEDFFREVDVILSADGKWNSCYESRFKDSLSENPKEGYIWAEFFTKSVAENQGKLGVVVDAHT